MQSEDSFKVKVQDSERIERHNRTDGRWRAAVSHSANKRDAMFAPLDSVSVFVVLVFALTMLIASFTFLLAGQLTTAGIARSNY